MQIGNLVRVNVRRITGKSFPLIDLTFLFFNDLLECIWFCSSEFELAERDLCLQFSSAILYGPMTKLYCKKLEPLNNMFVALNEPTSKP